jgi:phage shock protein PspC (stress-responsive transcriptional regulator)
MQVNRRLYRCGENRVLAGVAGGVAEFFDLDPTLVRVLWFISIFFGGVTLALYIGLAIITPLEPIAASVDGEPTTAVVPEGHSHVARGSGRWMTLLGAVLILFGTMAFVDRFLPALDIERFVVPAGAILIGTLLVVTAIRREPMKS